MSHILNATKLIESSQETVNLDRLVRDLEIADRYLKITEIQSNEKIADKLCKSIDNLSEKLRYAGRGY